jgi:hypothetical protein
LSSNLSSFKISDADLSNKSGGSDNVSTDDLMIKVSSLGQASSLLAGSDKIMSSGVNRMTGGKSIPSFQGQGAKLPEGSSGMLIYNDKSPTHVYGYDSNSSTWKKLKELAAGEKVEFPVGSAFTHESLGSINVSELYVLDPAATDSERGMVRMVPMGGVSSGGYANQFKNSFSTEVQMTGDLDVDGSATLGSWTVEGNLCSNANGTVESANITSDTASLGSWTVEGNLCSNANGTVESANITSDTASLGSWTVEGNLCSNANGTVESANITSDTASLGSWTVEGNLCSNANGTVETANITSDTASLGSWTVEGNLCKPVPSVNGTTPSYFQHRDHGIAIPAPDGKLYAIRVGSGGTISTVEVGTYSGVNPSFN